MESDPERHLGRIAGRAVSRGAISVWVADRFCKTLGEELAPSEIRDFLPPRSGLREEGTGCAGAVRRFYPSGSEFAEETGQRSPLGPYLEVG